MATPVPPPPTWSLHAMQQATGHDVLALAAIRLAGRGIPVFPCVPGGKQPLTPHGFHDATTDPARIRDWWRRTPDANVAMPTGAASGVVVVDVDVHGGKSGYAAFEQARHTGLADAWAWLVRTPSGGLHAYYRPVAGEQRSWQAPRAHIDFRGDGGYIVVPPSRIATSDEKVRRYEVIAVAQHHPKPLDALALRRFLDPPRPTRPPTDRPPLGSRPDRLAAWVASRPEGARNAGLFWAACRMAEDGQPLDASLRVLGEAGMSAGLTEREAETTIRSAHRTTSRWGPASRPRPTPAAEALRI